MKFVNKLLPLLICLVYATMSFADGLYSAAYGDKGNPAIIFLHGGPGYNCFSFEASTAERLAAEGYYVLVFDQRGCGRSEEPEGSKYDFTEAVADMKGVYEKYGLSKATLIGHSWGGALGVVFAERNPDMVKELVLVGAPMDYQQSFKAIIAHSKRDYVKAGKEDQLRYIQLLETMDTTSLDYATYCFMHAMASGQYQTEKPAEGVVALYTSMMKMPDAKQLRNMTQPPVKGFYDNEQYTTLKLYDRLKELKNKVPVYGMFGNEDGLFDKVQLDNIKASIGDDNFAIVQNASHSVFVDQQDEFLKLLKGYMGR